MRLLTRASPRGESDLPLPLTHITPNLPSGLSSAETESSCQLSSIVDRRGVAASGWVCRGLAPSNQAQGQEARKGDDDDDAEGEGGQEERVRY